MIFETIFYIVNTKEQMMVLVHILYFGGWGVGEDNIIPFYLFNQCLFIYCFPKNET